MRRGQKLHRYLPPLGGRELSNNSSFISGIIFFSLAVYQKSSLMGFPAFFAEINGVFIYIQLNVFVHHLFTHFLCMRTDKIQTRFWIRKSKFYRFTQHQVELMLNIRR